MKNPDKQPRKDEDADTGKKAQDEKAASEKPADGKAAGMNYVFKISPADPKNNLDFEDVADK